MSADENAPVAPDDQQLIAEFLDKMSCPHSFVRTGIFKPLIFLGEPAACQNIRFAVCINIQNQIEEIVVIALALLINFFLSDGAVLKCFPVRGVVDIGTGHDIKFSIAVKVRNAACL